MSDFDKVLWSECNTLEEWVRTCIERKDTALVVVLLRLLPDEKKIFYRKVWKEVLERKSLDE